MAWKRKDRSEYRDCTICGDSFSREERSYAAFTCSPECGAILEKQTAGAYAKAHPDSNRAAVARYKERDRELHREYARTRRAKLKEARDAERQ